MFASSHQVCTCHSLCLACLVKNLHFTFMPRNTLKIAHSISSCQAKVCTSSGFSRHGARSQGHVPEPAIADE